MGSLCGRYGVAMGSLWDYMRIDGWPFWPGLGAGGSGSSTDKWRVGEEGEKGRGTGRRQCFLHMFQVEHYTRAAATEEGRGIASFFLPPRRAEVPFAVAQSWSRARH